MTASIIIGLAIWTIIGSTGFLLFLAWLDEQVWMPPLWFDMLLLMVVGPLGWVVFCAVMYGMISDYINLNKDDR